jgi:hypothetical protein
MAQLHSKNVDEIDSRCQFHQHFMSAFAPIFLRQKVQTLKVTTKKLRANFLYEKDVCKMCMILTKG